MRDDPDKILVKSIRERFDKAISNERDYWNVMKNERETD